MLSKIKIGDRVRIHNRADNIISKKGFSNLDVIDADEKSFAVAGFGKWWFYRDTRESYVGDAKCEI